MALHHARVKRKGSIALVNFVTERKRVATISRYRSILARLSSVCRVDHDNYVVGSFGDSPRMATELADLVMAGIKRATASLASDYGEGGEPMPKPGDFVMMLDGDGHPRLIWRTIEITIKPLSEVDEALPGTRAKVTAHGSGGSMPIAAISPDKPVRKASSSTTMRLPCSSASRSCGRSMSRIPRR